MKLAESHAPDSSAGSPAATLPSAVPGTSIAIVEDDQTMGEGMSTWIAEMGHKPTWFVSGAALLAALRTTEFSLFVLDWGLPDMQGIDLLRRLRGHEGIDAPVIFCTARGDETDVVEALHEGADDFIVKPIRHHELAARISATLRRAYPGPANTSLINVPPFTIDTANRVIYVDGKPADLQNREYELAVMLFQNLNGVVSRTRIIQTLWGAEPMETSRSLDTHVSRIRRKLGLSVARGVALQSVYGLGYRLQVVSIAQGTAEQDAA